MEVYSKLVGLVGNVLRFNRGLGSRWKTDGTAAGAIEARNSADSAYVIGRGAPAVGPNDWLTLAQAGASVQELRRPIAPADFGVPITPSTFVAPAGAVVMDAEFNLLSPFDGGAAIALLDSGGTVLLGPTDSNLADASATALNPVLFQVHQDTPIAPGNLQILFGGVPTVGSGFLIVRYAIPQVL